LYQNLFKINRKGKEKQTRMLRHKWYTVYYRAKKRVFMTLSIGENKIPLGWKNTLFHYGQSACCHKQSGRRRERGERVEG
jgi:hypothetical protein